MLGSFCRSAVQTCSTPEKMCVSFLGLVLAAALPGALRAQTAACAPPVLRGGFFFMKQDGARLSYSCDAGRKPVVSSQLWWATVTCENDKWSHEPQCIDERSCIPPIIPNAKYTESQTGWYEDNHIISVSCDDGYELKRRTSTARCINGKWSPLPVCEKQIDACDMPPKLTNAVIINQEPKEVFASDSEVQYECQEGYTTEGEDARKITVCRDGAWTEGPSCNPACVMTSTSEIKLQSAVYLKEGETRFFPCIWENYLSPVKCINGRLRIARCCLNHDTNCLYS